MDTYAKNKTSEFVAKMSKLQFVCGLSYLGIDNYNKPKRFIYFNRISTVLLIAFMFSEYASFFTQFNLSEKQASDQIVFAFSHPILMSYSLSCMYYRNDFKKILFKLSVELKKFYNDLTIEKEMIRKSTLYSILNVVAFSAALFFYSVNGIIQIIKSGMYRLILLS